MIGDIALCRAQCFKWDVKRVSWLYVITTDPMAVFVRVRVLTLVSWLDWEFSQDTRVNNPTLVISAMESLVTTGSQDTSLTSHPKDSTLHKAMSHITALEHWDIFFRPEERVPPTGPPTPLPATSGLPSRDWPGPTLLSFRSKVEWSWIFYTQVPEAPDSTLYALPFSISHNNTLWSVWDQPL